MERGELYNMSSFHLMVGRLAWMNIKGTLSVHASELKKDVVGL